MPKTAVVKLSRKEFLRVPDEKEDRTGEGKERRPIRVKLDEKDLKITNRDKDNIVSMFGRRSQDILRLIEGNDKDGATSLIYKQLLKMLVTMVPVLESVVRRSKGRYGTYQVNQLVSQLRELLADVQAVQDRGMLGKNIIKRYVRPAFMDIAMQMVTNDQRMLNSVLMYVPEENREKVTAEMKDAQKELARFIQSAYRNAAEEIIRGLT